MTNEPSVHIDPARARARCHPQYQAVAIVKTATIFAGLNNLHPDPMAFIRVLIAVNDPEFVGCSIMQQLEDGTKPEDLDWRLYILEEDNEDPIDRLSLPMWLVSGAVVATENPNLAFEEIEPTGWYGNLHAVLQSLPTGLKTNEVWDLADKLIGFARVCPEKNVTLIREALKAKGEAVKALRAGLKPTPSEADSGIHVVVISL